MHLVHRDRAEPALPQMASPAVPRVDPPGIAAVGVGKGRPEPVGIGGNDDQVNVVGHQAIGPDLSRRGLCGLGQQLAIGEKIILLEKGRAATIAALRDMIGQSGDDEPGKSGDGSLLLSERVSP